MSACDAEVDGLIEAITSKLNNSETQTGTSQNVTEGYSLALESEEGFMYRYHVYIEVDGIQETYDYYVVDAYTGEVTAESML